MPDPWKDISPSGDPSTLHVRRVNAHHPLDLFRGKDHSGNYVFSFRGAFGQGTPPFPRLAIIEMALTHGRDGLSEFVMRLLDASHVDIFRALCADLVAATETLTRKDDGAGLRIILARLQHWRQLLRGRRDKSLSDAQVLGLFGELLVMRDVVLAHLNAMHSVTAWRGAHMDEQDFLIGDWLIEVKTQLSSADSKIAIASENQLDSRSGDIILCHQTLNIAETDKPSGRSLNSLVKELSSRLEHDDVEASDLFLAILIEYGYAEHTQYDTDTWELNERAFFMVRDDFPRITATGLPPGVENVQYGIRLSHCERFKLSEGDTLQLVFGTHE